MVGGVKAKDWFEYETQGFLPDSVTQRVESMQLDHF